MAVCRISPTGTDETGEITERGVKTMKYNMAKIMRHAWWRYESYQRPFFWPVSFGECLKEVWEDAKKWPEDFTITK